MKPGNWQYFLEVDFEEIKDTPARYPQGVKMYFTNLPDAFTRCILVNPYSFLERSFSNSPDYFPYERSLLSSLKISGKDGSVLLEAKLQHEGINGGANPPGLYYYFPQGIKDFEKKLCRSLKDFKGYDPNKNHLLVSYLVNGKDLKATLAFDILRQQPDERNFHYAVFPVKINSHYFGFSDDSPRSVDPNPYQEVFFYKDPNSAIRHLLSLNFNQLSEEIAWEKDLPFFYSSCRIFDGFTERVNFSTSPTAPFYVGKTYVNEPGVYLQFKSYFTDADIEMLLPFKVDSRSDSIYKVGVYDKKSTHFVLEKKLELSLKALTRKIISANKNRKSFRHL